jgi:hypothetical protein
LPTATESSDSVAAVQRSPSGSDLAGKFALENRAYDHLLSGNPRDVCNAQQNLGLIRPIDCQPTLGRGCAHAGGLDAVESLMEPDSNAFLEADHDLTVEAVILSVWAPSGPCG